MKLLVQPTTVPKLGGGCISLMVILLVLEPHDSMSSTDGSPEIAARLRDVVTHVIVEASGDGVHVLYALRVLQPPKVLRVLWDENDVRELDNDSQCAPAEGDREPVLLVRSCRTDEWFRFGNERPLVIGRYRERALWNACL